jgi:hypothetical protein
MSLPYDVYLIWSLFLPISSLMLLLSLGQRFPRVRKLLLRRHRYDHEVKDVFRHDSFHDRQCASLSPCGSPRWIWLRATTVPSVRSMCAGATAIRRIRAATVTAIRSIRRWRVASFVEAPPATAVHLPSRAVSLITPLPLRPQAATTLQALLVHEHPAFVPFSSPILSSSASR